eukprot:TRINITY_DN24358_c0_g1_i1.p1 TRINITY_DN24358_c0_g1~~TRINITY_DN24358_c0_g1_i1.p1  ORF type:complete len:158 (-),score=29.63 TRINITY_DN24358_c0_g1_i1:281-754(-)
MSCLANDASIYKRFQPFFKENTCEVPSNSVKDVEYNQMGTYMTDDRRGQRNGNFKKNRRNGFPDQRGPYHLYSGPRHPGTVRYSMEAGSNHMSTSSSEEEAEMSSFFRMCQVFVEGEKIYEFNRLPAGWIQKGRTKFGASSMKNGPDLDHISVPSWI